MDEQTFTFSWEVKNFSLCFKEIDYVIIHRLFTAILNGAKYFAEIFPTAYADPGNQYMSLLLTRFDKIPISTELCGTIQLVAEDGTPGNEIKMTDVPIINRDENIAPVYAFGVLKLASMSELKKLYVHNDTLKVRCVLRKINKQLTINRLSAITFGDVQKVCKRWKLTNFSQVRQGKVLEESVFLQAGKESFDICLSIERRPSGEVVIIEFARRCEPPRKPLILNTLITVLDAKGKHSQIWKQDQHVFNMETPEVWQFPTFIHKAPLVSQKNKYLAKDVLKLKCEIAILSGTMKSEMQESSVEIGCTHSYIQLTEDMKDLYNSKRFTDVRLRVFGKTVAAHKFVLQSRSETFAKMLDDVEGTDYGFLNLTDVSIITLKRMLKYMYTDEIADLEYDDAAEAYIAAHKYGIESLKCKYSFVLQSHLRVSNVCSILMRADDCCDYDLKDCAIDFIQQYRGFVCLSEEWECLLKERPLLAQQTIPKVLGSEYSKRKSSNTPEILINAPKIELK